MPASDIQDATDDAFVGRVDRLLRTLGAMVYGFSGMTDALAEYRPTVPPRYLYSDVLTTKKERELAFSHELRHAYLHPSGSEEPKDEHGAPERSASSTRPPPEFATPSEATEYRELIDRRKVVIAPVGESDKPLVEEVVRSMSFGRCLSHSCPRIAWSFAGSLFPRCRRECNLMQ